MNIFVSLLTVLFIALKLTGFITWSWLWVLSPLWVATLAGFAIVILAVFLNSKQ